MADFTGFNPAHATHEIETLREVLGDARYLLSDAFTVIASDIAEVWASPKAKEFGGTYVPQMNDLLESYTTNATSILKNVVRAIEIMANANGASFNGDFADMGSVEVCDNFKEEKDGIVGMNVAQVELYQDTFKDQLKAFFTAFAQVDALDISLYDPHGSLKQAFKTLLTEFETKLNELVESINKAIQFATLSEINTIRIAKNDAATTMSA